jgi:hypothetical protein
MASLDDEGAVAAADLATLVGADANMADKSRLE